MLYLANQKSRCVAISTSTSTSNGANSTGISKRQSLHQIQSQTRENKTQNIKHTLACGESQTTCARATSCAARPPDISRNHTGITRTMWPYLVFVAGVLLLVQSRRHSRLGLQSTEAGKPALGATSEHQGIAMGSRGGHSRDARVELGAFCSEVGP